MPLLIDAASALIVMPINALILWVVLKLFKIMENRYVTALKVAAIAGVVMFVIGQILALLLQGVLTSGAGVGARIGAGVLTFLITLIAAVVVYTILIKKFFNQETKKALLITVVFWVLSFAIGLVVAILIGIIAVLVLGPGVIAGLA